MSEIFEGVLVASDLSWFAASHASDAHGLKVETQDLGDGLAVVYRNDSRREAMFTEKMEDVAAVASGKGCEALVIRFDSSIGHRSASLFRDGQLQQAFGEHDELYVPLDESGEPISNASPLKLDELDPNEEYETIENAIQLGLRAFGKGNWDDLFRTMTTT